MTDEREASLGEAFERVFERAKSQDWSVRQAAAAYIYGEDSDEFRAAAARAVVKALTVTARVYVRDTHQRLALLDVLDGLERYVSKRSPNRDEMMGACGVVLAYMNAHVDTHEGPMIGPLTLLFDAGRSKDAFAYLRELRGRITASR